MRKLKLQELNRVDNEAFKKQPKTPLVLVLDNIRSGLNVGSAFRTSDGFGLEKIYLCGITATPPHKEILKTAIGASESVAWEYSDTTLKTILKLKKAGFKIVAVEQVDQRTWLQDFIIDFGIKYALVFGNEVDGISEEILPHIDACIEIPQMGTKHSLNISVCVGIVVWDFFKKIKFE
ncbi:MAG: RNA methyltransferase [Saprospiraceae bacterium]|jgi:23S rRNA (guanosine2251-2'-O)-methyltransferase|nr:RNA methyltransferase [Saprospiraceae bacterium]